VVIPPGEVIHVTLEKLPLGGSDNTETRVAGIVARPDPDGAYLKIEFAYFSGGLGDHFQDVQGVGLQIHKGAAFHPASGNGNIFKEAFLPHTIGKLNPRKAPVSGVTPVLTAFIGSLSLPRILKVKETFYNI
jgi:hypothetical protein